MAAYFQVSDIVTCRLTAKNWDQLQNPMLGYRVWGYLYLFVPLVQTYMQFGTEEVHIFMCVDF